MKNIVEQIQEQRIKEDLLYSFNNSIDTISSNHFKVLMYIPLGIAIYIFRRTGDFFINYDNREIKRRSMILNVELEKYKGVEDLLVEDG